MTTLIKASLIILTALFFSNLFTNEVSSQNDYDIVISGGTSAGVVAAVEYSRMGKSVQLIEPYNRIRGLTTGDLSETDIRRNDNYSEGDVELGGFLTIPNKPQSICS